MQAIWKGAISFGMVTIPIKVFSATEEKDISFRQVHVADGGRIRYKRVCQECGNEVPYSDIGKGYEMPDGRMIVLEPDDFADLPLSTKKVIDVLEFVPVDQVDPLYLGKAYYLAADGGPGAKPYVLLRVREGSLCAQALPSVTSFQRGRKADERVAVLRPKLPTVTETLALLDELLEVLTQAPSAPPPSSARSSAGKPASARKPVRAASPAHAM